MIDKVPLSVNYAVDLTLEEFRALIKDDSRAEDNDMWTLTLSKRLEAIGCSNVDYDGHFGTSIFLTLDAESDTEEMWNKITVEINDSTQNVGD